MSNADAYDAIVVGAGAAGAVFIHELTRSGMSVLAIEKGKFFENHREDFVENELAMFPLVWDHNNYQITGDAFDGGPNLGANVGGGTLAWTASALRFFERDFRFLSQWGAPPGSSVHNWPLSKRMLLPYYDLAEKQMGVSGESTPWDERGDELPPNPSLPLYRGSRLLQDAFDRLGMRHSPGRVAVNSRAYDDRPACLNCGFCRSGCRIDAKYQADEVLIKPALATGYLTLVTDSVVTRVWTNRGGHRARAVDYVDTITGDRYTAEGRYIILCNNPIEIPRLLLSSTDAHHPYGIGNNYDQIGRNFFSHATCIGLGLTSQDLRGAVGHSMNNIMSLDTCFNRESDDYVGGFSLLSLNGAGAGALAAFPLHRLNGENLHERMRRYNSGVVLIAFIEALPVAHNRIGIIPDQFDEYGVPIGTIHYEWHPNDLRAYQHAKEKMSEVFQASDADEIFTSDIFESHPMGSMRMGHSPRTSATDRYGRIHNVPNLYIGGACLFVTGSSVNPTLTIHALALRSTRKIIHEWEHRSERGAVRHRKRDR